MSIIGNIIWFLFGGFLAGLIWFFFGLLWCCTVIGIPVGLQCFKFGVLMDTVNRCAYAFLPSSVATPKPTIFNINRTINIHMDGKVTVDEELAADIEGDPLKIGVSPSLMKGILKAYPNEEMEIYFYGRRSPIVFMGNTAKFLLLPVNIQD